MATSKTLTPTGVTIQIPEFTDQPDQRVNSNCIDKEADAINSLNNNINTFDLLFTGDIHAVNDQVSLSYAFTNYKYLIFVGNVIPSRTPNYDVPSIPFPTALIKTGTAINIDMYSLRTSFAINFSSTTAGVVANYSKESTQTYTPGIVKIYGIKV